MSLAKSASRKQAKELLRKEYCFQTEIGSLAINCRHDKDAIKIEDTIKTAATKTKRKIYQQDDERKENDFPMCAFIPKVILLRLSHTTPGFRNLRV